MTITHWKTEQNQTGSQDLLRDYRAPCCQQSESAIDRDGFTEVLKGTFRAVNETP